MSDSAEEDEIESVGQFLDEFYPHFAIMGIFGTIAIFLHSSLSGNSELIARSGIFAVLTIFSFTAAWIGWRALTELLTGIHEAKRHLFTEFGYALIIISTFTIAFTVINQIISSFDEVRKIAISITAISIAFIIYTRNYPIERYQFDNSSPADIAFIALLLLIFVTNIFSGGLVVILSDHITKRWIQESVSAAIFAAIHLTMSEIVVAIISIEQTIKNIGDSQLYRGLMTDSEIRPWSFHISVMIGLISILILTIGLIWVANDTKGETVLIWGKYWEIIAAYHYLIFVSIVSLSVWFRPWDKSYREIVASYASIGLFIFCLIELSLANFDVITSIAYL
jgi:hypothetical protein